MRQTTTILALLGLALFQVAAAFAGDAADKRNAEWIRSLESDPVASRRRLIHEIRAEAEANSGESGGELGNEPGGTTNRPDLIPVLEVGLSDEDEQVRSDSIGALKYMRHPKAYPVLLRALESPHGTVRFFAVDAISWLGDLGPVGSRAPSTRGRPAGIAPVASPEELAELRTKVIATLVKVRDKPDPGEPDIPLCAAAELVRLGAPTDPALFVQTLREKSALSICAALALVELGRKDTIELMISALRTAQPSRDHWITQGLKKLTGEKGIGIDADAWQKWLDAHRGELPEQVK